MSNIVSLNDYRRRKNSQDKPISIDEAVRRTRESMQQIDATRDELKTAETPEQRKARQEADRRIHNEQVKSIFKLKKK